MTWYPNYIFLISMTFSDHTCCHDNRTKYDFFYRFMKKTYFFLPYFTNYSRYHHHLCQSVSYALRHHLCKILCNSTTKNELLKSSCFCGYSLFRKLLTRKHRKSTNCIFAGYVDIWRFVPRNNIWWLCPPQPPGLLVVRGTECPKI